MKAMSGCIWLAVVVVAVHLVGTLAGGDYYGGGYGGYGGGYGGYGYNGYGGNYGYGGYDDGGGKSKKYAKLGLAAGLAAGITGGALLGLPLLLGLTGAAGAGMIGKRSVIDNKDAIMKATTRDCQARNECIRHVLQREDGVAHGTGGHPQRSAVRSSGTLNASMNESVRLCVKLFPLCSSQLAVPIGQQMSVTKSPMLPTSSQSSVVKIYQGISNATSTSMRSLHIFKIYIQGILSTI